MKRTIKTTIAALLMSLLYAAAHADTVFQATKPSGALKASEALAIIKTGKSIYKCNPVKSGPNLNPVNAGSASFHASVGKSIDNYVDLLMSDKRPYKCVQMELNLENGRIKNVKN